MHKHMNIKVTLAEITINEQIRKTFDKEGVTELAESIKANGMIQPIGLNKKGKKLFLIFGERRCRAIDLIDGKSPKKPTEIEAKCYENLSDAQVKELQIIENLQRQDISPMEEAAGFLQMKQSGDEIKDIVSKLGKNRFYVAQRLKLNDLIPKFQKMLKEEKMTIGQAIKICAFPVAVQKHIAENEIMYDGRMEADLDLSNYKYDLNDAIFDLADATLLKKAGACNVCPFNSACNTLFADEVKQKNCSNSECFDEKTCLAFDIKIKQVVLDPEILLLDHSYSGKSDFVKEIEKQHGHVYNLQEYKIPEKPDKVKRSDYDHYDTKKEADKEYKDDLEIYEKELAEYEEQKKTAKKGFIVEGNGVGSFVNVVLVERNKTDHREAQSSKKDFEQTKESGKLTAHQIDTEIARIKSAAERKDEIEDQKITEEVHKLLDNDEKFFKNSDVLSDNEFIAMIVVLWDKVSHREYEADGAFLETMLKNLGFVEDDQKEECQFVTWLQGQSRPTLNVLFNQFSRLFFITELRVSLGNYKKGSKSKILFDIARAYNDSGVFDISSAVTTSREKRDLNVSKSIHRLEDQKKELAGEKESKKKKK